MRGEPGYDAHDEGCVSHDAKSTTTTPLPLPYLSPNPLRDDVRFSDPALLVNPKPLPEREDDGFSSPEPLLLRPNPLPVRGGRLSEAESCPKPNPLSEDDDGL